MAYTKRGWGSSGVDLTAQNLRAMDEGIVDAKEPWYGTCSTAAATAAKVVTCSGFTLQTGSRVCVKFTYENTATGPTLNVNSTGALTIVDSENVSVSSAAWNAGCIVEFVYNGTYWQLINPAGATSLNRGTVLLTDTTTGSSYTTANGYAATPNAVHSARVDAKAGYYGYCTTSSSTAAKTVTLDTTENSTTGFTLRTGVRISIKFQYYNSATSPTLNVNSTGAKNIVRYGTTAVTTYEWNSGSVIDFVYDGTSWVMEDGGIATTTYYGKTKLNNTTTSNDSTVAGTANAVRLAKDGWYGTCSTLAATAAKTVSCSGFTLQTGSKITVKFSYNNTAASPTLNVNSTGAMPIYVNGNSVGAALGKGTYEFVYDGTSYNLIQGTPDYLEGTITLTGYDSDGTATTSSATIRYVKIGRQVTLFGRLPDPSCAYYQTTNLSITTHPIKPMSPSDASMDTQAYFCGTGMNYDKKVEFFYIYLYGGSSYLSIRVEYLGQSLTGSSGGSSNIDDFTCTYLTYD